MIDARFRPLLNWGRKPGLRYKQANFKTAYNRTLDKLEYELHFLKAKNVVVESGFRLDQIRNDGWPRGGTSPVHPGVVLYFNSADGELCFPCGTYASLADNMHAIALTLENLRAIDRYGVTLGHEQYRGFAALPPAPAAMSVEDAADFIAANSGSTRIAIIQSSELYRTAYRSAASRLHPDIAGDSEGFYKLGRAKTVLDPHHGLAKTGSAQ